MHCWVLVLAITLGSSSLAIADQAGERYIIGLAYDLEVASYCSIVDETVARGFRIALQTELERSPLSQAKLDELRGMGWQLAHAEWQNRGLGGFRNWCKTEGRTVAKALAEFARTPAPES